MGKIRIENVIRQGTACHGRENRKTKAMKRAYLAPCFPRQKSGLTPVEIRDTPEKKRPLAGRPLSRRRQGGVVGASCCSAGHAKPRGVVARAKGESGPAFGQGIERVAPIGRIAYLKTAQLMEERPP